MTTETKTSYLSALFYDQRDYTLLRMVNDVLTKDKNRVLTQRRFYPYFHPHGIKEMAESKGLRIAYAVVHLLDSLEVGRMEERLSALRSLRDEVLSSASSGLQKNTARVLLQIMKDMVRAHGNTARQLELAHDFRRVASGKPRLVRKYLHRYHLLEMPEEWNQLAFDDHVHDANTKGRKSSTHLIMDAWIKGIRRLRVIYYNHIRPEVSAELLEAAAIMGITVRLGLEFSTTFYDRFVQIIWVPRGFADADDFLHFLSQKPVDVLMAEGRKVSEFQKQYILELLQEFNRRHRLTLEQEYGLVLAPLTAEDFLAYVGTGQASLLHLAEFIHAASLPAMRKQSRILKKQIQEAGAEDRSGLLKQLTALDALDSEAILDRYLRGDLNPSVPSASEPFKRADMPDLMKLSPCMLVDRLSNLRSGYRVTLNLSDIRVEDVLEIIYDCRGKITRLEIFNLKDYIAGKTDHIPAIVELQQALNTGNVVILKRLIGKIIHRMAQSDAPENRRRIDKFTTILHDISTLRSLYKIRPLKGRIGSDSTGRSSRFHGMGLAVVETLPKGARHKLTHDQSGPRLRIPFHVDVFPRITQVPHTSRNRFLAGSYRWLRKIPLLSYFGQQRYRDWLVEESSSRMADKGNIVTLGGLHQKSGNGLLPGHDRIGPASPKRSWAYLNTWFKNGLKVFIGFVPAFLTFRLTYDWWVLAYLGAFIWFGITGLRNIVQAVLGGGGLRRSPLIRWNDYVSWERITDSLMFTGFSVPLLDGLVKNLILNQWMGVNVASHPGLLYALIALANGIYLTSHNLFRGLPKEAAGANFFRSVLSIPIAFCLNFILGWGLALMGVGQVNQLLQNWAAVISKAASDIVAGLIEGAADRAQNIRARLRDYHYKIDRLFDTIENIELAAPESDFYAILNRTGKWLNTPDSEVGERLKIIIIHMLDLLHFWMYQPRARTAFRAVLRERTYEEREVLMAAHSLLKMEREISLLLIEGIIGEHFSRPLAFYLARSPEYLAAMKKLDSALQTETSDQTEDMPE